MPSIQTPDGRTVYLPGTYISLRVASSSPGPLPNFHVPVLMAPAFEGHPYNADATRLAVEPKLSPFREVRTASIAAAYYGTGSAMDRAMIWAKRHGLPLAFATCLSPLTRAAIIVEAAASVEQFTFYPRKYGAPGNWPKILWNGSTNLLEITPVKRFAMVAANIGASDIRIQVVGEHGWLVKGATVQISANGSTPVARAITKVIKERQSDGQYAYFIEVTSAPGALTTANYAIVFQWDETHKETYAGLTDCQDIIDTVNAQSEILWAVKHANFTNADPVNVSTATALNAISAWGTVTAGTSPAHTDADVTAFIALMNAEAYGDFAADRGLLPQAYYLASSDRSQHEAMRDYAEAEATRGFPISVMSGVGWGDHVLDAGDDTDPLFRAASLDSDYFGIAAPGLDGEPAYLSLGPAAWARRIEGGVGHNLTADRLIFTELERQWDEINSGELTSLTRGGVVTVRLILGQNFRWGIAQGVSTLQANEGLIWNVSDGTTWSFHQRDLADFINRVVYHDFEEFLIGEDEVDRNSVASTLNRRVDLSLARRNYIKPNTFRITSLERNSAGSGWDLRWQATPRELTDYITAELTVVVGE